MVKLTESMILKKAKSTVLQKVRKLNFWACDLTDISILKKLPNLTIASLSSNQITSLADLSCCSDLEELYIRQNGIHSLSELVHLKSLPRLRVLWLEGSPCTQLPEYRQTVLHLLPHLERLDNLAVEESEVELARQLTLCPTSFPNLADQKTVVSRTASAESVADESSVIVAQASYTEATQDSITDVGSNKASTLTSVVKASTDANADLCNAQKKSLKRPVDESLTASVAAPRSVGSIANVLQAVLCLLPELEHDELKLVSKAVRDRVATLH